MFLKRRKAKVAPRYIEARSFYGFGFHIIDTSLHGVDGREGLCGVANALPASSVREVTRENVIETWDKQHESWHWCRGCVGALFEIPGHEVTLENLKNR